MSCGFVEDEKIVFRWKNGRREPVFFVRHDERFHEWVFVRIPMHGGGSYIGRAKIDWLERRRP